MRASAAGNRASGADESSAHDARGMTAMTQLLPAFVIAAASHSTAERRLRILPRDYPQTYHLHGRVFRCPPLFFCCRCPFRLSACRPPPAPLSSLPPLCPSSARRRYSFPERKKRSGDFSEPLFIFGLPLPADSESRKVKKSPTVPCKARIRNPAFARLVSSLRFCAPNVLKICRKREVKGGLHPAGRSPDSINLSWV